MRFIIMRFYKMIGDRIICSNMPEIKNAARYNKRDGTLK